MAAAEPKTQIFYINVGGTLANAGAIRYAWRGKVGSYDNIAEALGVVIAKDTDKGLVFGAGSPTPAKVRISYIGPNGSSKSAIRFCEPDKISGVTTGGTLNNKEIKMAKKAYKIYNVTLKSN